MKTSQSKWLWSLNLAIILLPFFVQQASAQEGQPGIEFFVGTFKDARAKAKAENKHLFFDAYAVWCGPCKAMDKEVYSDPEIGNYFRQKFVALKVDMEQGEGPELAKKLSSIDGYPSLLFFNPDGSLAKTILGSRKREDFLAEAKLVAK